ncbi:MAG: 4'-phosphopantetheinyl transferase superfamily protein [Lachnospiraceae bacterium]|nr:4'-phosphopantetheinyl transferase superfamily protein [Lachnospiraceae bacterium]
MGNINDYTTEYLAGLVCKERVEKSMKYKFEEDRRRSLLAYALLGYAVSESTPGISLPVSPIKDELGKPHLYTNTEASAKEEIHFSLSHSGDYAVCVLNDSPIGIDIESFRENTDNIAKRFFSPKELKYSKDVPGFFKIWTLKESFMKITGLGMRLPLDYFYVSDLNNFDGSCKFMTSKTKEELLSDPIIYSHLCPYINDHSPEFSVNGLCTPFEKSHIISLAYSPSKNKNIKINTDPVFAKL